MTSEQTNIREKILEAYGESTLSAISEQGPFTHRIAQGIILAVYAVGVIFLEAILEKSPLDASLADRIVAVIILTTTLIGFRTWLDRRSIINTFHERYAGQWGLVKFYREDWTYLRYLVFHDALEKKFPLKIEGKEILAIRDHFAAEADLLARTRGLGFTTKYAGYAIGLSIAIFSKMAMKFTHPVMINTLIVIASLMIFTNVLQKQFRTQTQKLEEVRQLWNWYAFDHRTDD
jgi:hypothetical protein